MKIKLHRKFRSTGVVLCFVMSLCLISQIAQAQLTPPGLGKVNTAEWFAIGLKQNLNQEGTWTSTSYLGSGRTSQPNDYNPVEKPAIYVINQEFAHHYQTHWQYAGAVSYRWQKRYSSQEPFALDSPFARQEIRFYGKYAYLGGGDKVGFSLTLRPELRLFFNPDFSRNSEMIQLRTRFKGKVTFNLNERKTHKIITSAEFLLASSKYLNWNRYSYSDSRLCLYYSFTLPAQKVTFDLGYMTDLIGSPLSRDVHYVAMDVVLKNIF